MGAETERDASVLLIQANWPKIEAIGAELNYAIMELSEAVSTSEEGIEISGDPSEVIAYFRKEAVEAHERYVTFKEKHNKELIPTPALHQPKHQVLGLAGPHLRIPLQKKMVKRDQLLVTSCEEPPGQRFQTVANIPLTGGNKSNSVGK